MSPRPIGADVLAPSRAVALPPVGSKSAPAIVWLFWVYLVLVIFEGSLRKWILPSLSSQLLFIRDPIVVLIYLIALAEGRFPFRPVVIALSALALFASGVGLLLNPDNVLVTIYGLKSNFLHLPLIFVMGRILTPAQVLTMGRFLMVCAILMLPVVTLQFRASPDDYWNCGPGGVTGAQIEGAMGKVRPPGFFSYISGVAQFCALVTAFVLQGVLIPRTYPRLLVWGTSAALIMTVALSISRATLGAVSTVLSMVVILVMINRRMAGRAVYGVAIFGVIVFVLSNFDLFKEGSAAMESRLTSTGDMDRGFVGTSVSWSERVINDLSGGIEAAQTAPLLGYGIGYGTNAGAKLLTGRLQFLAAEGEWGRIVMEMGAVCGVFYLCLRIGIVVELFLGALRCAKADNAFPLLLFGSCSWPLFNGQFGQTATVGFAVAGGVFCLAAQAQSQPVQAGESASQHPAADRVRSRSRYAERLFGGSVARVG